MKVKNKIKIKTNIKCESIIKVLLYYIKHVYPLKSNSCKLLYKRLLLMTFKKYYQDKTMKILTIVKIFFLSILLYCLLECIIYFNYIFIIIQCKLLFSSIIIMSDKYVYTNTMLEYSIQHRILYISTSLLVTVL